ncbi:MAG: hypothetical protein ACLFSZ_03810 [Puniceicoccaceae bacterium]
MNCCLDPADISKITTNLLFPDTFRLPEETPIEAKVEFGEIAEKGRDFPATLFLEEFPKQPWTHLFEMVSGTGRSCPLILLDPNRWVPLSENHEIKVEFFDDLLPVEGNEDLIQKSLFEKAESEEQFGEDRGGYRTLENETGVCGRGSSRLRRF